MTRANGGLIFQGLMWLESNAVANACLDASNPSQGSRSKVKARPDSECRGQRDFMTNSNLQNILGRYIYISR